MKKALFLLMMAALCCSVVAGAAVRFGKEIVACGDDQVIVVRPAASQPQAPMRLCPAALLSKQKGAQRDFFNAKVAEFVAPCSRVYDFARRRCA